MKFFTILAFLANYWFPAILRAQDGPQTQAYPEPLTLKNQQFAVRASIWPKPYPLTAVAGDTVDLGTDGYPGAYAVVLTGQDSIRAPYDQRIYIPLITPTGKAMYCLRFNGVAGQFSDEYLLLDIY